MARITLAIYRFFQKYPVVFYAILVLSAAFFAYFGLQMKYEEDSWVLYAGHEGTAVTTSLKYNDELKYLNIVDVNTYKKKY